MVKGFIHRNETGGCNIKITRVGIYLAKNVFQLHGVDESGHAALSKRLSRTRLLGSLATLEPDLMRIDASAGGYYLSPCKAT